MKRFFRKYVVDALSHMAFGLFCSLILGLIIGQIAKIPGLDFLGFIAEGLSATSPLVGACIGFAIAAGLKAPMLVQISSAIVGALGYKYGGPVGSYIAAGSTITKDVPEEVLAVARARQTVIEGWIEKRK